MFEHLKKVAATLQNLLVVYGSEMRRDDREKGEEALAKALDAIAELERPTAPGEFDEFSPAQLDDEVDDDYHCETCGRLFPDCECEELLDEDDEDGLEE